MSWDSERNASADIIHERSFNENSEKHDQRLVHWSVLIEGKVSEVALDGTGVVA
ncbi:hypothetical protein KFZ56_16550 [Virgibacillus sp. NKC19-3]|uniref:hypothetical protein n=1 Tax=Virgibacillus saliphilus TaxID=2831674 RepID=UPI001C9A9BAA|nr:hypothetical protein [Virgibacillus sp. NKC19-3]MBY7144632.1 hypothetical protein [Virgibacillus sp. NKC19-3]